MMPPRNCPLRPARKAPADVEASRSQSEMLLSSATARTASPSKAEQAASEPEAVAMVARVAP
eukprot:2050774-Rhodomonas_salina.3